MKYKRRILLFLFIIILSIGMFTVTGCGSNNEKKNVESTQLWTCGMHPEVLLEESGQCPKCGMNLVPVKTDEQDDHSGHKHESDAPQLWTCGMHPEVLLEEPGQCPKCGMDLVPVKTTKEKDSVKKGEGKILYWQAPMDPTEIHDKPGKSKMGMDLIPVYEDDASLGAGGTIKIDPVTVQNMGVRTYKVQRQDFLKTIRTVGNIEYNEKNLYTVNTKISGWIEKLFVDYTGKSVKRNQPLLEIYSPELVTTQEEYLLALKNYEAVKNSSLQSIKDGAESLLKSTRKRLEYWDIPSSEIDMLTKTGKVKKNMTMYSRASGIVVHKNVVEGGHIKEGMNLYQIADLSSVWVQASIYDNELPWIKEGQLVEMELSYLPGKKYKGKVTFIYPYLNAKARDVRVRMEFPNPKLKLKPGMYVNISIKTDPLQNILVIPTESIVRSGIRNIVFIARGKGRFEPRQISIGEEGDNGMVRVITGLLDGESIVTSAQFMLDSESRLQEAIQKMLQERMEK